MEVFGIPLSIAGPVGGGTMLLLAVGLVITQMVMPIRKGLVIPKETYDSHIKFLEDSKQDWKASSLAKDDTIKNLSEADRIKSEAIKILADETGKTVTKVMESLQDGAET